MGLNKEQAAAVEYLDGPLLVLAGPGTGKTQLLSAKVAYILEHTDANPENILCLTFTESGASNMRERLGTMIGQAAAKVNIYTYHAFGSNLLERYKNYAENFDRRLDAVIDGVTSYKILHDIQANLPVTDILKTANIDDLADTIQHAKSARLSADDLATIAAANLSDSTSLGELASSILVQLRPRSKFDVAVADVYQPLLKLLTEFSSPEPIVGKIERSANFYARELADLIKTESAKEKPSVAPLSRWKDKRFERNDSGAYRLKDYIANRKLASLAEIMRCYDERLRADGLFDFADMIEEAIRALKEDRGFRLSLSEVFQYILLDEFQDTNPSQFELIRLLTDYEKPVVMAVGDDDQAIYEFQGASASNLLDFQNYYHSEVVVLHDNYRSVGAVLEFSRQIAAEVTDSFAKHHGVDKTLRSMTDLFLKSAKKAEISAPKQGSKVTSASSGRDTKTPVKPPKLSEIDASAVQRHEFLAASDEYYWLAREISQLIKHGEDPENIAIIAPRHKYIAPLLPYLKAHRNIDIAYEKKSNLLDDPKLHELVVVAEFVSDLAHERQPSHRLLELLSFPWLEISPLVALESVHRAREQHQSALQYLLDSGDERLRAIAAWLAELAMLAFDTPLELWLDYLIGSCETPGCGFRSPYLAYYSARSSDIENFEFYQNLNVLKNTVLAHSHTPRPKLADFIQMLEDYTAAGAAIINTSPYRDGEHAVQIMSAHKSKGLEFKYVFLIAVDELAWGKAKGNNNLFSLPVNLAQIRHTGITDDEQLRLLFVAATRAKQHLILTNSVTDFADKTVARLGYLNEQRDDQAEVQLSPFLPAGQNQIQLHYKDFDLDTRITAGRQGWSAAYQVLTPDLKTLLRSRLAKYRLSATDLTNFIDIIYAGPEAVYRRQILRAPDEPLTTALAYGNLVHATLEQVTNAGLSDADALQFYRDKSLDLPLTAHEISELQAKGAYGLEIVLRDFQTVLRQEGAKAEVNLSPEHPTLGDIPLTGKIDHLAIDHQAKTIEVYDFKTGNYHANNWQSHPTLYKYALQLGFYKLLLNLSTSYRDYRVTRGHILFVTPDQDGKVYDRTYEYTDAAEAELKALIAAVYHQITSLDFVTDPELNLAADQHRTLRDIKAFVAKLLTPAD